MRKSASWAPAPNLKVLAVERNETDWIVAVEGLDHGTCPVCGLQSISRHSSYRRTLQDLSAQGKPVSVRVRMTRWRCRNDRCERRIFAERLPELTAPFARRTARLAGIVRLFGHGVGGRPSERLMIRLGMPVSDTTILRDLKRSARSHANPVHVRVVGIDDWAWRKGMTYGTVIVDLERRRVVDLLPDRSAASTAKWIEGHPEVEIISRDRAGLYAEGARAGAPPARQVADRFHLLQNFREAVERQLGQFGAPIREVPIGEALQEGGDLAATDEPAPSQPAPQKAGEYQKAGRLARRANRQVLFDKIRELYNAGKTVAAIARVVGFGRKSVARWVRLLVLPPRNSMTPKTQSTTAYHQAFLLRRWAEGITNGRRFVRGNPTAWLRRLLQPFSEAPCTVEGRCYAAKAQRVRSAFDSQLCNNSTSCFHSASSFGVIADG